MKIRLGYVGVEDTMETVLSVIRKFTEFEPLPLLHTRFDQIADLMLANSENVDMWLFSGPLPYSVAKQSGRAAKPLFYIPYSGTSLYRTLFQIHYRHGLDVGELSFDIFTEEELQRIFAELGLTGRTVYAKPYAGSSEELIEHHIQLWKDGTTKAAVTCAWSVHKRLIDAGVTSFRVTPTEHSIEEALISVIRAYETMRSKDAQVAVQTIEADPYAGQTPQLYSSDELFHMEMTNTKRLLDYARKVQGSLKTSGPGRFVVFTTRGALREVTDNFTKVPDADVLPALGSEPLTSGIGIGSTAYEAEIFSGKALMHAKEYGKGTWMTFFDDKTITGPLGKPEQLSFSYASEQLQGISALTSLSVATLGKLKSVLDKRGSGEMNAHELAQHLRIMPRSARRILIQLEAAGFAEIIGEDSPHPRGRPRNLYRISLRQG